VLAASASDIVVPLITGLLGGVIGATFARITSRNDLRRDRYADALSALRSLEEINTEHRAASAPAKRAYDLRDWMLIDALPVGNAYATLVAKTNDGAQREELKEARLNFIDAARAYSRWTLPKRALLHVRAVRLERQEGRTRTNHVSRPSLVPHRRQAPTRRK
jgi:hypothetical protein